MATLNILGAQRIKALTEMLNEIEKQALKELRSKMPTEVELKHIVDKEFGLDESRLKSKELELELRTLLEEINAITGESRYVTINTGYSKTNSTDWLKRHKQLQQEQLKEIDALKDQFADKKRKLWLCETLEEAKKLVGI